MVKDILMPAGIFPSEELVGQWYSISISSELNFFREQAYTAYLQKPLLEDKELSKFMQISIDWALYKVTSVTAYFQASEGIWLKKLEEVYSYPLIKERVTSVLSGMHNKSALELLVQSMYDQAYVLYIPQATLCDEPIVLEHVQKNLGIAVSLLIIIVESEAQVTFIKRNSTSNITISVVHVFIESGASVKVVEEYNTSDNGTSIEQETWYISQNATLTLLESISGGTTIKINDYYLIGNYAHVEHTLLSVLQGKEKAAHSVRQHHHAKNSFSKVEAKFVLLGTSSSFYRGTISIEEEARGSQAEQYQSALMASKDARTCAIPSLEIKTNEVHCKHGSAAAHIQEEDLWYLLSRGFERTQAQKLLIEGFLKESPLITSYGHLGQKVLNRLNYSIEDLL